MQMGYLKDIDTPVVDYLAQVDRAKLAPGATITLDDGSDTALFGEGIGRVVVATPDGDALLALATAAGVPAVRLGHTGGESLTVRVGAAPVIDASVAELHGIWDSALDDLFG